MTHYLSRTRTTTLTTLVTMMAVGLFSSTAFAQIQTLDVQMGNSEGIEEVTLEPLTFQKVGEIDPREKVARKPFIGTLIFEKDQILRTNADGTQIINTTTSSCAVTAAYDPKELERGIYDIRGYSSDHCVTNEGKIDFDRAVALFPGAGKSYSLLPEHFHSSGQTSDSKAEYGWDWARVSLPEDPELSAVPLHKGDYEGLIFFEASTKGYKISPIGVKTTHYVSTWQSCYIARRYQDYSSDKVTTCRTAEAMSGGGFFVPETGALYSTLSRIGEDTLYSYSTLISAVGKTRDSQHEARFQMANYMLRGQDPFGDKETVVEAYQVADAGSITICHTSDGSSLIDKLMLTGLSYRDARKFC